jgi:alanine racemase
VRGLRRRALIDRDAFARNLKALRDAPLDARADAYGHGLALLAPVAHDAGVAALVVSDQADAELARASGFGGKVMVDREGTGIADASAAYGLAPGTRPVLTLVGEVIAVKRVGGDAGVSYGYSYRTSGPTTLALIGLGYADGVPRLASNRATVLVGAVQHPLVGRVAMDQFVVDCGDDVPELGSDAVLFGDPGRGEPGVGDWATATERRALDLTAGLGPRIVRVAP